MAYTSVTGVQPPFADDDSQSLLYKICWAIWGVINGDFGFLIRGNVNTSAKQTSAAPSSFAIRTSGGDVETLAAGGVIYIQNLGTNPLFVKRGTGASSSSFNYELQAGGAADDGTGGAVVIDDFIGVVSATGTSPRFIAWQ